MLFDFNRLALTGWLNRRVETWEYASDARWRRNISLDINQKQLMEEVAGHVLGAPATKFRSPDRIKELLGSGRGVVSLPLCDVDRCVQVSDWSIRDQENKPLCLLLDGMACAVLLSALNGAIYYESILPNGPLHQLPLLTKCEGLTYFLGELFSASMPPTRFDGSVILLRDEDASEAVRLYVQGRILQELDSGHLWLTNLARQALVDFQAYWEESSLFRYFVVYYAIRRVYYARVDLSEDNIEVLKCSMLVTMDLVRNHRFSAKHVPFFDRLPFTLELDGLGVAEETRIIVKAPEGLCFTPYRFPGTVCNESLPANGREKFYSTRFLLDGVCSPVLDEVAAEAEAEIVGSLTPGCATAEARKTWYMLENELTDEGLPIEKLYRRMPIGESHVGPYYLHMLLTPRLGLRSVGYTVFLLLSAVAFLLCWLDSGLYDPNGGSGVFSLATLFVITPMIIAIVANREEEPFLRRAVFWLPRTLCGLGIICDAVGFVVFALMQAGVIGSSEWGSIFAGGMAVICCVLCCICMAWVVHNMAQKWLWSRSKGAYDLFPVPIYLV